MPEQMTFDQAMDAAVLARAALEHGVETELYAFNKQYGKEETLKLLKELIGKYELQ